MKNKKLQVIGFLSFIIFMTSINSYSIEDINHDNDKMAQYEIE